MKIGNLFSEFYIVSYRGPRKELEKHTSLIAQHTTAEPSERREWGRRRETEERRGKHTKKKHKVKSQAVNASNHKKFLIFTRFGPKRYTQATVNRRQCTRVRRERRRHRRHSMKCQHSIHHLGEPRILRTLCDKLNQNRE